MKSGKNAHAQHRHETVGGRAIKGCEPMKALDTEAPQQPAGLRQDGWESPFGDHIGRHGGASAW